MSAMERRTTDVVVVGGGVAGMRAALALAPLRVALVTKTPFGVGGSSPYAQGGIAAAMDQGDSPSLHAADTLAVGAGLNDSQIVDLMTGRASREIDDLVAVGTRFDRTPDGALALGREGGHRQRRIVHAGGDATGAEMVRALSEAVARRPGVEIWERVFAEELVLEDGRVAGLVADLGDGAGRVRFAAQAVVLATGGGGQVYLHTTNPPELTGDGLAMAARAGATLVDLEFVQFHPTALAIDRDPLPLLTEALRGEGASLVDEDGERFLAGLHPDAELAPRDFVARAIFERQMRGHRMFLDARHSPGRGMVTRFPTVYRACLGAGIDPMREPIPVTPAAHYFMGGVRVDSRGRTSLPGLWACGEVSATGAHGANRLASNSLLEAVVFGSEAAKNIVASLGPRPSGQPNEAAAARHRGAWTDTSPPELRHRLRQLMWENVGLVRHHDGLERVLAAIVRLEAELPPGAAELRNLLVTGRCVALAALARRETRGSHVRVDYPASDESLRRHLPLTLPCEGSGESQAVSLEA